jgi:hypothetical protein
MKLLWVAAAILLIGLVDCSVFHKQQETRTPNKDLARLQLSSKMDLYVSAIDGKSAVQGDQGGLAFEPGIHTFSMRFDRYKTPSGRSIPNSSGFDLSINARAGIIYRVEFKKSQDFSTWSACIVEASTNRRVSSIITSQD